MVIKIGGSLLYDDDLNINLDVVKFFKDWFSNQRDLEKVVFVIGGGKLSRFLVNQVKDSIQNSLYSHRIGLKVTQVNSSIVCGVFNQENSSCYDDIDLLVSDIKSDIINVGFLGGVKVGWSTDMVAAKVAFDLNINFVSKVSNIDYIYSSDPSVDVSAVALKNISWSEYLDIFRKKDVVFDGIHKPGMNLPIDFPCASFCKENNVSFRVGSMDGFLKDEGSLVQ